MFEVRRHCRGDGRLLRQTSNLAGATPGRLWVELEEPRGGSARPRRGTSGLQGRRPAALDPEVVRTAQRGRRPAASRAECLTNPGRECRGDARLHTSPEGGPWTLEGNPTEKGAGARSEHGARTEAGPGGPKRKPGRRAPRARQEPGGL